MFFKILKMDIRKGTKIVAFGQEVIVIEITSENVIYLEHPIVVPTKEYVRDYVTEDEIQGVIDDENKFILSDVIKKSIRNILFSHILEHPLKNEKIAEDIIKYVSKLFEKNHIRKHLPSESLGSKEFHRLELIGKEFFLDFGASAPVHVKVVSFSESQIMLKYLDSCVDRTERFSIHDFEQLSGLKIIKK